MNGLTVYLWIFVYMVLLCVEVYVISANIQYVYDIIFYHLIDVFIEHTDDLPQCPRPSSSSSESRRRGVSKRRTFDEAFKLAAIKQVRAGKHPDRVALKCGTSRSNIVKWCSEYSKVTSSKNS